MARALTGEKLEKELLRLEGMQLGKAGQRRHLVIDLRIILHGAGPQRIEAVV